MRRKTLLERDLIDYRIALERTKSRVRKIEMLMDDLLGLVERLADALEAEHEKCTGRIVGYLGPWGREQGNRPYDLHCQLDAGHPGYHIDQDRMPFGLWAADRPPGEPGGDTMTTERTPGFERIGARILRGPSTRSSLAS